MTLGQKEVIETLVIMNEKEEMDIEEVIIDWTRMTPEEKNDYVQNMVEIIWATRKRQNALFFQMDINHQGSSAYAP